MEVDTLQTIFAQRARFRNRAYTDKVSDCMHPFNVPASAECEPLTDDAGRPQHVAGAKQFPKTQHGWSTLTVTAGFIKGRNRPRAGPFSAYQWNRHPSRIGRFRRSVSLFQA